MGERPRLLIANRGEIAVRIARSAADLGIETVAVHAADDRGPHVDAADTAVELPARGPAAYLDAAALVDAATGAGCGLLHPGYGFLSERPELVEACEAAGIDFVGPRTATLATFGDKHATLSLARSAGVPVLPSTSPDDGIEAATELLAGGPIIVKAVAGGGGRGMRVVREPEDLPGAWERCASEATAAFGDGRCYAERYLHPARHVEVQLIGDGTGAVVDLGDRECSLQRRHQKILELAPAPAIAEETRRRMSNAAIALGAAVSLRGVATVEMLVDAEHAAADDAAIALLEVNPRLQVEHTVTEEVTGLDLVACQLRIAAGETLGQLGLTERPEARGCAAQLRVTSETLGTDGTLRPSAGTVEAWSPPTGPGVRVDAALRPGAAVHPGFDPLLAKVVVHGPDWPVVARRADRALAEMRLDGVGTSVGLLRALLARDEITSGGASTGFVEEHLSELAATAAGFVPTPADEVTAAAPAITTGPERTVPEGQIGVRAPTLGTVIGVDVEVGDAVAPGAQLAVLEAMKMEHVVAASEPGLVVRIDVAPGDVVEEGRVVVVLDPTVDVEVGAAEASELDLDHIRPDLAEVIERHDVGLDHRRPASVERRRRVGRRTTRENVADLVDDGTFVEYGPLVLAAQRRRRSLEELILKTPGDGLVGGVGVVNGDHFGEAGRCVVASYDYTVLAGTQGGMNHLKKDRLFDLAERMRLPVVVFTEGGGGRPGDTDGTGVAGLDCLAFWLFGQLSGLVPLVGINAGYCFAGNAALLGSCDVVIATEDSNIGMGGPAMIEGGGLGVVEPTEVGPIDVQWANGVVDLRAADEAEAVELAKRYLSYFQGPIADWSAADQRLLRHSIPENRLRVYEVRDVIETLADTDSVLELRGGFGTGMVTCLARVEGRPLGIVANDPTHLGGAIDSDAADKSARFLQLCDAFDLPVLFLCDTPGIMVGPEAETSGTVRHASRLFAVGGSLDIPFATIVLRKGYGLGAQAMAGGSFRAPDFIVAWPTGEFGGMGLEGAVRLGYRDELAAIEDPDERQAAYEERVARMYEIGKGINFASVFEIDDVIDPAASRDWIVNVLLGRPTPPRQGKKRPCVDTW